MRDTIRDLAVAGRLFGFGLYYGAVAAKYRHIHLRNPSGSGKQATVYVAAGTASDANGMQVTLTTGAQALTAPNTPTPFNFKGGGGASGLTLETIDDATGYYGTQVFDGVNNQVAVAKQAQHFLVPGTGTVLYLPPNSGLMLSSTSVNVAFGAQLVWSE